MQEVILEIGRLGYQNLLMQG